MDVLIEEVKGRAERVAVSSVIERHDGLVPASKIASYNNLVYNLCTKHNINYINNDDTDKRLLYGSNLDLNKAGDKALGGAFYSYLKSSRTINNRQEPSRNNHRFFSPNWTIYNMVERVPNVCQSSTEKLVNIDMSNENVSSDLLTSLNYIPNERGFKMAFLNIVTLPSKIDEIRHSMCSKNIDLIANIGPDLASQIHTSSCNFETYVKKAKSELAAFQPTNVNNVYHLLSGLSSNKATRLDKISCKIIKIAALASRSRYTDIYF
jgi:hypothetical protein